MDDGQVTVHAHAGDEEDGCVEVEVQDGATNFAGHPAKGPAVVLGVVDGPQREGEQEQQVGDAQVQHERVSNGPPRGASVRQHTHRQGVGYGPQHGDSTVDDRNDRRGGHGGPAPASGRRGGVHIDLRGGGGVEKRDVIWDCHHGSGCLQGLLKTKAEQRWRGAC